jgi:aryl-alcohol dehydrogenase-like predicted oxidoreductase
MEAVDMLIRQGKVRAAGVCNYNTTDLAKAGKVLTIASNQLAYSMVKRDIEAETVPYCIENNIGILVYSPLQRGILGGKIQPERKFRSGDSRPSTPYYKLGNIIRINEFLDKIRPIAEQKDISLSQLVLRWTLQQPGVSCLLAGVRNEKQLIENAGTLHFELGPDEIKSINAHLENLDLILDV